ncbi:hypothetical protein HYFRA_00006100 [Hymenoscyphus fraxineus]|uniref:NAD dependent epimerase/dehydratase n=1 Tax=Hymenoscyphus fraxineus TaxID=746836 RepID=A0A9N9PVN5_9HELO|nr:hypothetical protein HYFRA_00006100 [Hymenoscyphus fraxineus]
MDSINMPSEKSSQTRTLPMEVLVLGLCRTGTLSLKIALEKLGYPTYHMASVQESPGHAAKWVQAMRSKYEGDGSLLTREFFDGLLGEYGAVTDVPCASFVPELIVAYPDAKIILSTRDADGWVRSMEGTIVKTLEKLTSPLRKVIVFFLSEENKQIPIYMDLFFKYQLYNNFSLYGKRAFEEHNHMVRRLAPSERFLEFEAKDGWGPLCEFLGKERPDGEFPRTNNVKEFGERSKAQAGKVLGIAAARAAKMLGGLVLALWVLLWGFGVIRR